MKYVFIMYAVWAVGGFLTYGKLYNDWKCYEEQNEICGLEAAFSGFLYPIYWAAYGATELFKEWE